MRSRRPGPLCSGENQTGSLGLISPSTRARSRTRAAALSSVLVSAIEAPAFRRESAPGAEASSHDLHFEPQELGAHAIQGIPGLVPETLELLQGQGAKACGRVQVVSNHD